MEPTILPHTRVLYPWQSEAESQHYKFTGVPPHVAILHEVLAIAVGQRTLVTDYLEGLTSVLDARIVNGGQLSEATLRQIIADGTASLRLQMTALV
jgi:hypothetical protein